MDSSEAPGPVLLQIGFDIGGTFTDILVTSSRGDLFAYKVLTKVEEIGARVVECIREIGGRGPTPTVTAIIHGTTIASNAIVERKGAVTGYITTDGFRDDVDIPRPGQRGAADAFGLFFPPPTPLVPRHLRAEVIERVSAGGAVEIALDLDQVDRTVGRLVDAGIEALAICLINAHVSPIHEDAIVQRALAIAPGLDVIASHEISPEIGEYERASTTILHALLKPVVRGYLSKLEEDLDALPSLLVMQANGGVVPASHAKRRPANLIECGPAAGVLAASAVARECELDKAVALDMGGTTVKVCLIEGGRAREAAQMEVSLDTTTRLMRGSGHALRTSGFDLVEIGAGGGSVAWIDEGGALRVGPQSAGAKPGPACYDLGGEEPTITDACVVLGYLNPATIAGGTVPIRYDLAHQAIEQRITSRTNLTVREAAYGICRVAVATMRRAVSTVTVQRGCDPRECTLVAFGGAGPLLAAALAEELEITTVQVPPHPGLFCALGLLTADMRFDYSAPIGTRLDLLDSSGLLQIYEGLEAQASEDLVQTGIDLALAGRERSIDLQYVRQASYLTIPIGCETPVKSLTERIAQAFHEEHARQYGYDRAREYVVASTARLRIVIPNDTLKLENIESSLIGGGGPEGERSGRMAYFGEDSGERLAPVYSRAELRTRGISGPAIIDELDSTVVIPPGWSGSLGKLGSIVLKRN